MIVAVCTLQLDIPISESLKDKRRILKSMLTRLHNEFNVSAAEVDDQDVLQSAVIGVAAVTNETRHAHQIVTNVIKWIEKNYPDVEIMHESIEIL